MTFHGSFMYYPNGQTSPLKSYLLYILGGTESRN